MGFHKRYINFEKTENALVNKKLTLLYKCDALIFDDEVSSLVYNYYINGLNEEQIINKIKTSQNEMRKEH